MITFGPKARIALKFYPKILGVIRNLELKNDGDIAHIYWDDGRMSYCPVSRLLLLPWENLPHYPWEKPKEEEKEQPVEKIDIDKPVLDVKDATQAYIEARSDAHGQYPVRHNRKDK